MKVTEYEYPFDEAKAQWIVDTLIYDNPLNLWSWKRSEKSWYPREGRCGDGNLKQPTWFHKNTYIRTEP